MILPWQGFWAGGGRQESFIQEADLQFPPGKVLDADKVGMRTSPSLAEPQGDPAAGEPTQAREKQRGLGICARTTCSRRDLLTLVCLPSLAAPPDCASSQDEAHACACCCFRAERTAGASSDLPPRPAPGRPRPPQATGSAIHGPSCPCSLAFVPVLAAHFLLRTPFLSLL